MLVAENELAVTESKIAPQSTPMPQPTTATASQEFPATPITAQTLLLLTSTPKYERIATPTISEPPQLSTSHSQHTENLFSGSPSSTKDFPNAAAVQMDLLLANQHTIMANQTELQVYQQALERRMDKIENLMLQILKALWKGKGNQ